MGETWCFDLDDTISSTPSQMRSLMEGLRAQGHQVHVLTGIHHSPVTPEDIEEKRALLKSLGCGDCYDVLAVASGPEAKVPANKVAYLRDVKAAGLIDNDKANCKAARKAGFLALRHMDPKKG